MTTYYVSANIGSDNNIGSSTSPFATLQTAANHTHPGDFVEVMNGTYTGWPGGDVLAITTSGTAGAPITYEAANGQTPIIDSSGSWNGNQDHGILRQRRGLYRGGRCGRLQFEPGSGGVFDQQPEP